MPAQKTPSRATVAKPYLTITLTGLIAIFLDERRNRAMIGFLDAKNHVFDVQINGKSVALGKDGWSAMLQSDRPSPIRRGGTRFKDGKLGDAFDYIVSLNRLEGGGAKSGLPLKYELLKGRLYLNSGEFTTVGHAFKGNPVEFVRQDSRMPLETWRPRPVSEVIQIKIPLVGLKELRLKETKIDGETLYDFSRELNRDHVMRLDNECPRGAFSPDTDFVKYYDLIADRIVPAAPVEIIGDKSPRDDGRMCGPVLFDGQDSF